MGAIEPIHILIVLIVVFLLFGASRLPGLGRSLGQGIREFKKGIEEIHTPIKSEEQGLAGEAVPGGPAIEVLPAAPASEAQPAALLTAAPAAASAPTPDAAVHD